MIILLFVICIALIFLGLHIDKKYSSNYEYRENFKGLIVGLSIFLTVCVIIAGVWVSSYLVSSSYIDDKISMYQEENTNIEKQLDELVNNYMIYESDTLTKFKAESSITLVSLYPELKSDTLVATQITTYTDNNNRIKDLKEKQINSKMARWWLYFGH